MILKCPCVDYLTNVTLGRMYSANFLVNYRKDKVLKNNIWEYNCFTCSM